MTLKNTRPFYKKILFASIVIFATIILTLVFLEIYFTGKVRVSPSITTGDPLLQYRHRRNLRVWARSPNEYRVFYRTNSHGFRGEEVEINKPKDKIRVLGLGDSFTFGIGNSEDETYLARLKNHLNLGRDVEIVNTGTLGWGTDQALKFLKTEGLNYKPDILVLGFFSGNDWEDNLDSGMYVVKNNKLEDMKVNFGFFLPEQGFFQNLSLYKWLSNRSSLFSAMRIAYSDWRLEEFNTKNQEIVIEAAEVESKKEIIDNFQYELTRLLVEEIHSLATDRKIPVYLLIIPDAPWGSDVFKQNLEKLKIYCKMKKWQCIDMEPVFTKHNLSPSDVIYPLDGHWTPKAHELAAIELGKAINDLQGIDSNQIH